MSRAVSPDDHPSPSPAAAKRFILYRKFDPDRLGLGAPDAQEDGVGRSSADTKGSVRACSEEWGSERQPQSEDPGGFHLKKPTTPKRRPTAPSNEIPK